MKNKLFFVFILGLVFFTSSLLAQETDELEEEPVASLEQAQAASSKETASPQNKITLDMKGMDIVDVLKMLATRSGMNIVVGKNVTGRVTLFLRDVSTQEAFEIILLANDLAYEKKGEIINVMTQRDYELLYGDRYKDNKELKIVHLKYAKAVDLSKALNQVKTNIGRIAVDEGSNTLVLIDVPEKVAEMMDFISKIDLPVETKVISLNYAQADKVQAKLQDMVTKGIGSLKVDERTNKISITDYPEKVAEIAKTILAFDDKTPQVLIDAQIIELKPSDKFQMGVNWDYWIKKYFEIKSSLAINTTGALIFGTHSSSAPGSQGGYAAVVDLLRTIGEVNILSSPRIIALNNQEAKILVGTKDAYITSTTSQGGTGTAITSQSVNFVDTGVKLYVTPTINKDGFITMKIKPEVSSATRTDIKSDDKVTQIPIVSTSESETTLMVKDGVTIIMGGLRKDKREKTIKKLPIFGDIPGLGLVFRSTSDEITTTDLVILLTPHIISGEESFIDFREMRPKEGAVFKMVKGEIVAERITKPKPPAYPAKLDNPELYNRIVVDKIKLQTIADKTNKEKGEVKLSFVLNSAGQLKGEPRIISSTNSNLDIFTVKRLKGIGPFPPLPPSMNKPEESFVVTLEYK